MIILRQTVWRSLSAVGIASALAACGPGGEAGGKGVEQGRPGAHGEGGEAGEGGGAAPEAAAPSGEAGEAGIAGVMDGLSDTERSAARLQQLKGFFMAAHALMSEPDLMPAGVLIGQGVLEVYEAFPSDMTGYNVTQAQAASRIGLAPNASRPEMARALSQAMAGIDARLTALDVNGAVIAGRMIEAAEGLYRHVDLGEGLVDETEYQHSFAAALAARDALQRDERRLRRIDASAYAEALRETDAFIALWNGPVAPPTPAPVGQILAQGSRAQLALSSLQTGVQSGG